MFASEKRRKQLAENKAKKNEKITTLVQYTPTGPGIFGEYWMEETLYFAENSSRVVGSKVIGLDSERKDNLGRPMRNAVLFKKKTELPITAFRESDSWNKYRVNRIDKYDDPVSVLLQHKIKQEAYLEAQLKTIADRFEASLREAEEKEGKGLTKEALEFFFSKEEAEKIFEAQQKALAEEATNSSDKSSLPTVGQGQDAL